MGIPVDEANMMSSPLRFLHGRSGAAACSLAMLLGSTIGCTGEVAPMSRPGATGSAGKTGSVGGTSPGTGGIKVIDTPAPPASGWFETLKATNCAAAPTALPASRIWRLSATQWQNTVAQALGVAAPDVSAFPPDQIDPQTGFSDDSTGDKVTLPLASAYFDTSDRLAMQAAPAAATAFPCLATAPIAATCAQTFVQSYGPKLFRRALTPAESSSFAGYLASESKLDPAPTAVISTLKAMMMSPSFFYRTELGNSKPGPVDLTSDEIASMLSYTIADVPPDASLTQAASSGQLADPAMRTAQAERLAALPGAKAKLATFWREYLALGDAPTTPGIDASMHTEAETFFSKVVWDNAGGLKELLTAPYTYADSMVAQLYGSAKPAADGKLMLDPAQRAGILTSASMLAKTSAASQAATVIHRGLLVRERLLCTIPPPPPAAVVPDPAQIQMAGPDATAKENYAQFKMAKPGCDVCHQTFQPLGLAFEAYDAVGKFRTAYPTTNKPIDTTGELTNAGDATGPYTSVVDMAAKIGGSQIAQYCFAQQYAAFAFGRAVNVDQEACTIRSMGDFVISKGGQARELLASFAATPTVTRRFHQ
ncbi:MAG: hypothetical protein JWM82_2230 [Myxococcales bacterium]|nr:hypothetical protein [Myxococcales bacterium]